MTISKERRLQLNLAKPKNYKDIVLTEEEQKEWHFCWDWDELLIHRSDPEFKVCSCVGGDAIRKVYEAV